MTRTRSVLLVAPLVLILAFGTLGSQAARTSLAAQPAPASTAFAPVWQAGDRTVWALNASQSVATERGIGVNAAADGQTTRTTGQSLRMRITVLADGRPDAEADPDGQPASPAGVTLGVAFERLELTFAEERAEAMEQAEPKAPPPAAAAIEDPAAAPAEPAEPAKPSALRQLATLYVDCALRVDLTPDGRVDSLTGLERVREFLMDHPELDSALGPLGPAQMPRTLESLWLFDPVTSRDGTSPAPAVAAEPTTRSPGERWSHDESLELTGVGRGKLSTAWTFTGVEPNTALLDAEQLIELAPGHPLSSHAPDVEITEQRRTISVRYDLAARAAQRIEHAGRLVVTAKIGAPPDTRQARATLQSRTVIERTPAPPPAP